MINLKELFLRAKNFPEYLRLKKLDSQLEKSLIKQIFQYHPSKLVVNQQGEIEGKIKLNTLRIRLKIINYKQVVIYAKNQEIKEFSERIKIMEAILKIYNKIYIKQVTDMMFFMGIIIDFLYKLRY